MMTDLVAYYAARAVEYERVYDKLERQPDLARLLQIVPDYFRDCRVLELACGTGYWTAHIATTAKSVIATDIAAEVLEIAKAKPWSRTAPVTFVLADAFSLDAVPGEFDASFAGFWWSHVPRERLKEFLAQLNDRLPVDACVLLLDNRFVEGSSSAISRTDRAGNTFQQRTLANGEQHEVLKNFPTPAEVRGHLGAHGARAVEVVELQYYWYVTYRVAAA